MSEINNPKDIKFNIKDRNFSLKKNDFKNDSKELFLFDYLTDNKKNKFFKSDDKVVSIHMLDQDEGTKGTITSKDIQIFLQDKKVQKKGITENDMVKFLNKMMKLNPTQEEKTQNELSQKYKYDNGNTVMTDEIKEMFGLERKQTIYTDTNGQVKKGLEIFDLNNDGKIDDVEEAFIKSNNVSGYSNINDLKQYIKALDNVNKEDGIITQEDKLKAYKNQTDKIAKEKQDTLNNFAIRDEKGEEVITKEVKELFKGKNGSISFDEITDSNGKVKKGLEVFDLNNDGKLDENEKSYFANGGHSELSKATKLTITDLTNAIEQLDKVGYTGGGNPKDSEITTQNKQNLHKMLSSSSYMLENLGSFPEGLQDKFAKALKEKHFYETKQKDAIGVNTEDALKIDAEKISKPEIASIMVHELAHTILSDKNHNMDTLQQEVITFYTEYRFYEQAKKNDPDFIKTISAVPKSGIKEIIVDMDYMNFVENLKKNNPKMSEKDLAVEAFLKFKFESYNGRYKAKVTPDEIRNADYSVAEDFFKRK